MKYFTKEELEDITKELVENPTRETLKKLNDKYNGSTEPLILSNETPVVETVEAPMPEIVPAIAVEDPVSPMKNEVVNELSSSSVQLESPVGAPIPVVEDKPVVEQLPIMEEQPVISPIPNFNVPNMETPKIESNSLNKNSTQETPNFELPKLDTPIVSNQNNEPINFTGNLFETGPSVANLMQTTDNFNSVPNTMPTTEVPVTGTPFFGPHVAPENNPIPVGGPVNNMPVNEQTMFGQMQQNYM